MMKSSSRAHAIIKNAEGLFLKSYRCPSGVWTIGWGHTKEVKPGMTISLDQAKAFFNDDIAEYDKGVSSLLTRTVEQHQFDALVSFSFNVGLDIDRDIIPEGLGDSRLLRLVNAGDMVAAADEFEKWVFGGSPRRRLPGLVIRRKTEKNLFMGNYKL